MSRFTQHAAQQAKIQRRLRELARETGTDVEGVVEWLASSYNPEEAWDTLRK